MNSLQILREEKSPAIALLAIALKRYGSECFLWEPVVLRHQLEQDYSHELTDLQSDKLQAAIMVLTSERFETNVKAFELVCHLFCNIPDSYTDFEPLHADELVRGYAQAMLIRHEPIEFHEEVRGYAGKVFFEFGLSKPPKVFPTALIPREAVPVEDEEEKNEVLQDLFDKEAHYIVNTLTNLE